MDRDRDRDNWKRDRSNYKRDQHKSRSRSRSREKKRNYQKNYHGGDHYSFNNSKNKSYYKDNRYQNNNYNKYNQNKAHFKPEVHFIEISAPKSFLIAQNSTLTTPQNKARFKINIKTNTVPPPISPHKTSEGQTLFSLKNKITPIQKVWTSHIKQYLNDSEFVEIFRNRRSLAYGPIEYGKTIINYRQDAIMMMEPYNNKTNQSKIFSRAYFKLWEILEMGVFAGKQKEELKIASVAEGPGGFIHSLIDYRLKNYQLQDSFYSITLRIDENTRNAKDWNDQKGKKFFGDMRDEGYKINLSYGKTGTGDLLKVENIDYFVQQNLKKQKCYLVTGDGGIQCIGDKEFDYQEVFNAKLFLGEIITALLVQQVNGKFILKVYDCAFQITKELLTLLSVFYNKVQMVKPVTSRPGNSEKYMYCEGFRGINSEEEKELKRLLQEWTSIEPDLAYFENKQFVESILEFPDLEERQSIFENLAKANHEFMDEQAEKLKKGLLLAEENNNDAEQIEKLLKQKRFEEQISYAYSWCRKYKIAPIEVKIKE